MFDIFRKRETRQHVGGDDDVSIDYLGHLFEPRSDIEDIAQIGDLALAVAAFAGNHRPAMERHPKSRRHAKPSAVAQ